MNNKVYITLLAILGLCSEFGFSQINKKIIVEHFTNTRCGICANRNPGFYSNLNNQADAIHLSIHPSSPYSSCVFNQHNVSENDARTNYYGIYGSTPRLVINGEVISANTNYGAASLFDPYENQTSAAEIKIEQEKFGADSIQTTVTVYTVGTHNLDTLSLFVSMVEEIVFYNAPNGESTHHDVFRKALTSTTGMGILLPTTVGDSLSYSFTQTVDADWDVSKMYVLATLQEKTNKALVQAQSIDPDSTSTTVVGAPTSISTTQNEAFKVNIFPNPSQNFVNVQLENGGTQSQLELWTMNGQLIQQQVLEHTLELDITMLPKGIYLIKIQNEKGSYTQKLIK
ncbi:MAG: T9SS type A sorting domain-containing protein [Saprospiraceae bacterium]|nr:T9SS type A sorting domain-containing protein [Saprospiraceae bacterium]